MPDNQGLPESSQGSPAGMIGETAPSASSANASWGLQGPPRTFNPSKEYQDKVGVPEASGNYIDQAKSTVSGQLDQILSSDSALMRRAENFAGAKSNKTGMLGSSMATGAAQGAMIDKALPIAQQDAALYGQQDLSQQAQDFSKESQAIQQNYGIDTAAQQQVNVLSQMDKSQIGALELADQQFGYTQEITKNDQIFQELMTDKKYTQDDKVLMMNSSKDIMRDYMSSLVKAQTSGEFTEAEAKAATDNYNSAMGTLFSIWDTDMSFSF